MKKILILTILSIILLQSCGMLVFYQLQQNHVKEKMQGLLSDRKCKFEELHMSLEEYKKSKINSHEILFSNIMYDVNSVKITGECVFLSVIADHEEGDIIQKIKNYFTASNKQDRKIPDNLIKFLTVVYILPEINFSFLVQENYNSVFQSFYIKFLCFIPEILTPPPNEIHLFFDWTFVFESSSVYQIL